MYCWTSQFLRHKKDGRKTLCFLTVTSLCCDAQSCYSVSVSNCCSVSLLPQTGYKEGLNVFPSRRAGSSFDTCLHTAEHKYYKYSKTAWKVHFLYYFFFFFTSNLIESYFCGWWITASWGEEPSFCWLAFLLVLLLDAFFFSSFPVVKDWSPQWFCLGFFLYLNTVRIIFVFQSSKGFKKKSAYLFTDNGDKCTYIFVCLKEKKAIPWLLRFGAACKYN